MTPHSQAIAAQLDATTLQSFWAAISYLLAVVVTQPLYSAVSDAFGRKPPLYFAFLLFAAGSIVFATAQNMVAVILGRVLQGLGGGGINVLCEIIVTDMTTLRERPFYLGIMALPTAAGSILGPTIGALFTDFLTWRWIGWVNLPILGIAFALVLFFLRLRPLGLSFLHQIKGLDWVGICLFTAGSTTFILPLSWADSLYPWSSWRTLLPLLLGLAVLAIFALYESRAVSPILPHYIFRSRTASLVLLGSFIHGALLFTLLQYLPLFYQAIMLETRIESAVSLLPTSIVSVLSAMLAAIAVGIVGKGYRWGIWLSWAFVALGTGLLTLMDPSSSQDMRRGIPVLWGLGVGGLLRLNQLPIQASLVKVDDTALAVSLTVSFRIFGGLVGLAIGSTTFSSVFSTYIHVIKNLQLPDTLAIPLPTEPSQAVGFIPNLRVLDLPPAALHTIQHAYLESLRAIFYVMTCLGGLGFLISLFVQELSIQKTDLGRQRFEE